MEKQIVAIFVIVTIQFQLFQGSPVKKQAIVMKDASTQTLNFSLDSFPVLSPNFYPRISSIRETANSNPNTNSNSEEEQLRGSYSYSYANLCEAFHSTSFIVDSSIFENGCKLQCVILTNSSEEKKEFFDKSLKFNHNLHDGMICKRDHVCNNGSCVLDIPAMNDVTPGNSDKFGIVVIELIDAVVPKKDTITASDTYVKIEIKSSDKKSPDKKSSDEKMAENDESTKTIVDTTKVIWDTNHPSFNTTFKIEKVSIMSIVSFEVYDKDMMGPNDFIGNVSIGIRRILERDLNHKELTFPLLETTDKYYLRVKISWIAYN